MAAVAVAATRTLLLSVLLLAGAFAAHGEVAVPELRATVTDLAGLLKPEEKAALESKLEAFEREKGSQVAVLIVASTAPETIEQYSIRAVEAWKLGRKAPDDGVLLLVARDDRTLRIEVGRGLEGAIPDAIAKRVIEERIVPRFRAGEFAGGVDAGVDAILDLIRGEALPEPAWESGARGDPLSAAVPGLIALLVFGQILRSLLGRLFGAVLGGGIAFVLAQMLIGVMWISLMGALLVFVFTLAGMAGGGRGGGFGHIGGRGGFGGGGGGFSGGGGSFGGGGASGRW